MHALNDFSLILLFYIELILVSLNMTLTETLLLYLDVL